MRNNPSLVPIVASLAMITGLSLVPALAAHAGSGFINIVDSTMTPPGGGSYGASGFGFESVNSSGQVAFGSENGVWVGDGTAVRNLFKYNDPAPGGGGGVFTPFGHTPGILGDNGTYVFWDEVLGFPINARQGLFTTDGTTPRLLIYEGQPSPDGTPFRFFVNPAYRPSINQAGEVSFFSSTDAHKSHGGLFVTDGTTTSIVAEDGDAAPGGGTFLDFDEININDAGQVAFDATTTGGVGWGIFRYIGADGELAAARGQNAPGGGTWDKLYEPSLNDDGGIAFMAINSGGGPAQGIYRTDGLSTSLIAAVGQSAPGGGLFQGFNAYATINRAGEVAFAALSGTSFRDPVQGVYVGDGTRLGRVIGLGDALFGSTVTALGFGKAGMNDVGQVGFSYTLADGRSGVALGGADLVGAAAAPEPGTLALVLMGLPVACRRPFGQRLRRFGQRPVPGTPLLVILSPRDHTQTNGSQGDRKMMTRSTTRRGFWGFAAALALTCTCLMFSQGRASAQTIGDLNPEAGNVEVLRTYGVGVQIYQSAPSATDPNILVWKFVAPEAALFNSGGQEIVRHFGGPSWETNSGSLVVGAVDKSAPSPDPDAIPWLLVKAVTNTGPGLFDHVSFIQRLNTTGGKAPSTTPTQAGLIARVPYTATYVFFIHPGN